MRKWIAGLYCDLGGIRGLLRFTSLSVVAGIILIMDFSSTWQDPSLVNRNLWIVAIASGIVYGVSFVGFLLLLPRVISRILMSVLLGWAFFYSTVGIVSQRNFGVVFKGEALMILAGTSWEECKEFLGMYASLQWCLGVIVFLIVEIALVTLLVKCKYFKPTFKLFCFALVCQIPLSAWMIRFPANSASFVERAREWTILRFSSFSVWKSVYKSYNKLRELSIASKSPNLPDSLGCNLSDDADMLGIIVIGESSTRNRWSIYGYSRNTNPCLETQKDDLIVFDNVVAPASGTTECLRYLLSDAIKEDDRCHYLLPSVLKRANYDCAFLSNQGHFGEWDGVDTVLFRDCNRKLWIGDVLGSGTFDKPRYDGYLLSYLKNEVAGCQGKKVIFLHLIGSHMPIEDKCPVELAIYGKDNNKMFPKGADKSDLYDNSIIYTDYFLNEVLDILKDRNGTSFMLYISDHGESPSSKYWRFAMDRDLWEIPMVAWFSAEYKQKYSGLVDYVNKAKSKPIVSDQLLFGLTRMFFIEGMPDYAEEKDFLSEKFIPREKRYNDKVQGAK